ncbi:MAG: nucleotidyltransferase family protein [Thermaerobacter sp.]|nr:nucleotidyltransferase family protein [Thermaerobacter sp.]
MKGEGAVEAIVLAGQRNTGILREVSDAAYEGEIPVAGRPMLDWVLDALLQAAGITRVIVVGPASAPRPGVEWVPMGEDLLTNVMAGMAAVKNSERVLIATGDIPLVSGPIVDELLQMAPQADLVYPVVPREIIEQRTPGVKRTYVRLRDGVFTGGNLFLVNPAIVPQVADTARVLLSHRKSPTKLARDIGLRFLIRLFLGQLTLAGAERRVSEVLGVHGRVLVVPYAEVGVDVDKPSDWMTVTRMLEAQLESAATRR